MIRVHNWYEFSSSSSLLLRMRRASSTFPWLRQLRPLPSGPTALTAGRRDRTGIFVFIWCEWGDSEEQENQILYRAWKSTRSYSVGLQLRRHLFYCCTRIRPCWWLHTGSTQNPIIPTGYEHSCYARTSSICPLSSCSLLFPKMAGKLTEFNRTPVSYTHLTLPTICSV